MVFFNGGFEPFTPSYLRPYMYYIDRETCFNNSCRQCFTNINLIGERVNVVVSLCEIRECRFFSFSFTGP